MRILVGAHSLSSIPDRYRHRLGNLFSPGGFWKNDLGFSLDNYVYSAWRKGIAWDESRFVKHLEKVKLSGRVPDWVVCPDVVGDSAASLAKWSQWEPRLRAYGWPLAFAVQDGQSPESIPPSADLIFVGGSTEWKRKSISMWCRNFPRVHVARINTYRWLWYCHEQGAESVDGTGWFWQRKREYQDLLDYLAITEGETDRETGALFPLYPFNNPLLICKDT